MPPIDTLWLFLAASVLLILTPGQDLYLVMTRSLAQGARAGVVTAAGVSAGLLGHTLLVGVGLGALIRASDTLFVLLKTVGAAYLVWLGIGLLRAGAAAFDTTEGQRAGVGRLFLHGAVCNLLNPKIVVFYLAFLPQFVPLDTSAPTLSLIALGATFAALTFVIKAPIGCAAGALSSTFRRRPGIAAWLNRISGGILIVLGARLLAQETAG